MKFDGKDYRVQGPAAPAGFAMTLRDAGAAEGSQEKTKTICDRQEA